MEEPIKEYYVYVYLDPRKPGNFIYEDLKFDYEPFYVGKGKDDRCYSHCKKSHNLFLKRKIDKIFSLNLEPLIIKFYKTYDESFVYDKEGEFIKKIGRLNKKSGPLVNARKGGFGRIGYSMNARKLLASYASNRIGELNGMHGKKHTQEAKDRISNLNANKIVSDVIREKIIKAFDGRIPTEKVIEGWKNAANTRRGAAKTYTIKLDYKGDIFVFNSLKTANSFLMKELPDHFKNPSFTNKFLCDKKEIESVLKIINITKIKK